METPQNKFLFIRRPHGFMAFGCCLMLLTALVGCEAVHNATTATSPTPGVGSADPSGSNATQSHHHPATARIAAFNTALSRPTQGELAAAMANGQDRKIAQVAEVLQRTRPDVVLLSEIDFDATGKLVEDFRKNYLAVPQNDAKPIDYAHAYMPEVNTGQPSGADLDNNGNIGGPGDAHGWGNYPGHYGMLLLSRFPIDETNAHTFRKLRWIDLPGNVMPTDWYEDTAGKTIRLSSKTHAEVPVELPDGTSVVLMISHPTPPVFDGPEDRNGKRNHDEVRFWIDRIDGKTFRDDDGHESSLKPDTALVVMGDMNADPYDGDSFGDAILRLIEHPRLRRDITPASTGALEATKTDAGLNAQHQGNPAFDTGNFADNPPRGPGNLRIDYVLPSTELDVISAGVFWPASNEPHADLVEVSDHRLVWIDVQLAPKK